jgi:hypothetical protein
MSRASVRIVNKTAWSTDHLRAFVMEARRQVFGEHVRGKKLVVTFVHARRAWITGYAFVNGKNSRIRVPRENVDKRDLAQTLIHELGHNAGLRNERMMRRSKAWGFRHPEWRENVAWADALPLEKAPPKVKPTKVEKLEQRLAVLDVRESSWRTKAKRAATALKKIAAAKARIQKRMAAMEGGDK